LQVDGLTEHRYFYSPTFKKAKKRRMLVAEMAWEIEDAKQFGLPSEIACLRQMTEGAGNGSGNKEQD
jgi:hypothetical protein